ncbi:MAG: thioredoxin [Phycisphaerales bacterium]|nr:thioredoxin [Phycisphaerales bacterium]
MVIVECPNCGAKNRVDERAAADRQPVCGRCRTRLTVPAPTAAGGPPGPTGGHPLEVTDATFARDVLGAGPTPVLLDCWAPWCGPCRMIAPIMEQLAAGAAGRYAVAKLNTDDNPRTTGQFRIDAIPTMLIFKNGRLVDRLVGLQSKKALEERLAAHA